MDNGTILILVGIVIIVLVARKWDSFKWIFGLALVVLALWTAWDMGMLNGLIGDAKEQLPNVSVE